MVGSLGKLLFAVVCSLVLTNSTISLGNTPAMPANFPMMGPDKGISLTPAEKEEIISKGRKFDVPYHQQTGSKCGFYALKMVMHYYHQKNSSCINPPAEDFGQGDARYESLYEYGLRAGEYWSDDGGTNPWHLRNVAQAYGYKAWSHYAVFGGSIKTLKYDVMKRKMPVIVAVAAVDSSTGEPTKGDFIGGHWVIVEGFTTYQGVDYMIVKHGWSHGSVVWKVSDFQKSWRFGTSVGIWPKAEKK